MLSKQEIGNRWNRLRSAFAMIPLAINIMQFLEVFEYAIELQAENEQLKADLNKLKAFHERYANIQSSAMASLLDRNEQLNQDIAQLRINKIADSSSEMYRINKIADLQAENDRLKETISSLTVAFDELNETAKYHEGKVEKLLTENKSLGKVYVKHKVILSEIKEYCEDNDTMGDESPYYDGRGVVANRILAIISNKYSKSEVTGEDTQNIGKK